MAFDVEQKKGDPAVLDGRITVYAVIEMDPEELMAAKHSFASMVHNGFLVSQGNFKDQYNFRDFLKSELGISLEEGFEEGLSQLLERMDGLEATLDPQKLKERLQNMDDLNDFIPTPAKIVPFHSEEEIVASEGDVFYAGPYKNIGNAVLAVQALPMLYQARYREQEAGRIKNEIESLISQIERNDAGPSAPAARPGPKPTTEERLMRQDIPNLLYYRNDPHAFEKAVGEFRTSLKKYRFQEDVDSIVSLLGAKRELTEKENRLLELYAKKISSVEKEDFSAAEAIAREIAQLRGR